MSEITIRQLAGMVGTPEDKLLTQLAEAGMRFEGPDQVISNREKTKLLDFLRRNHGKQATAAAAAPKQITLKRRKVSEITVAGGRGASAKTVNVEVRARRTYVKRAAVPADNVVDGEREDALRKLKESQAQHERELADLAEQDRRRKEEQLKLEAAEAERKRAEEERARAEAEVAAARTVGEAAAPKEAEEAPTPARRHEAAKPARDKDTAGHKQKRARGSHRMREDDEGGARYAGGELHLTDAERACRSTRKRAKP
ncbi:MAG: translation initiation factor IF-2, partial [Rhodanobacteraceae bacterium]